jgi:hypothetical protein
MEEAQDLSWLLFKNNSNASYDFPSTLVYNENMKSVGLLPASGSASRLGGIPKFCLPMSENLTLLEWHVYSMLEVCDEVRISTRLAWLEIVNNLKLPRNVSVMVIEPSTMSDAIIKMQTSEVAEYLVGMPDTMIRGTTENHYEKLKENSSDLTLALWECTKELKGRVGQISIDQSGYAIGSADKDPKCEFDKMWGAFLFINFVIDPKLSHPGLQFQDLIDAGIQISTQICDGEYVDLGKFSGLLDYYMHCEEKVARIPGR